MYLSSLQWRPCLGKLLSQIVVQRGIVCAPALHRTQRYVESNAICRYNLPARPSRPTTCASITQAPPSRPSATFNHLQGRTSHVQARYLCYLEGRARALYGLLNKERHVWRCPTGILKRACPDVAVYRRSHCRTWKFTRGAYLINWSMTAGN
jgi:hypothetical protein